MVIAESCRNRVILMKTILIAEMDDTLAGALAERLCEEYSVHTCSRGDTAVELLDTLEPDILILDLMLPYLDGLGVLQKARHKPGHILALTRASSDYILQACEAAGIGYVFMLPCAVTVVAERVKEMVNFTQANPEDLTCQHLDRLGLNDLRRGYRQLAIGVPIFQKNRAQTLHKELYPAIAKACGCENPEQVESAIRAVIRSAWKERDFAVWDVYFPGESKAPSNRKFLNVISKKL